MAVVLYKDEEKIIVEPQFLDNYLQAGYSVTKDKPKVEEKPKRGRRKSKE